VTIRDILGKHLLPAFGEKVVNEIQKAEILGFRAVLAKIPGRKNKEGLSASRINYIMMAFRQILEEAADRFGFTTPYRKIKALKIQKTDVQPFSLAEVQKILEIVRMDYRDYLTVRFYTGMRTGEIDGLKWQYVDFDARQILVRETIVAGEEEYTKTDASQREIRMTDAVLASLRNQEKVSRGKSEFVFINEKGGPLDKNNFTRRVWRPLLRHLGLKLRRPYQTRHTAATLWLAAGENPQWIARQLGHASTEMLFRIYARFVPNNTRQDGSAFERLLRDSATQRASDADPA
jgi:integrase